MSTESNFENRLLTELTNLDAARPIVARAATRTRWRRPAFVVGAALTVFGVGAAAATAAAVLSGPRDFVVAGDEVSAGGQAAVKGIGCAANVPVAITFDGAPVLTLTSDGGGVFYGNFTVPASAALGQHDLTAVCDPDGKGAPVQHAQVAVVVPVPPVPPKAEFVIGGSAMQGGQFVVKGAGCAAGATVTITVSGALAGTTVADELGIYTAVLPLPAVPVGDHDVTSTCNGRDGAELVLSTTLPVVTAEEAMATTKPTPTG